VRRFDEANPEGLVVADAMGSAGSLLKTNAFMDTDLVYNEPGVRYEVFAVDQTYHYSDADEVPCDWTSTALVPAAPSALTATVMGSRITLAWQQPADTTNVSGYEVFRDGASAPLATVDGQSYEFDQGYETTHSYQVRSFNRLGAVLSDWATNIIVGTGQSLQVVEGHPWLVVPIGPEPLFDIRLQNARNQALTSVNLFYTGPHGLDPAQLMQSWDGVARSAFTPSMSGQHAGVYYVDWEIRNGSGRITASGSPSFTIQPTSPSNQVFRIE